MGRIIRKLIALPIMGAGVFLFAFNDVGYTSWYMIAGLLFFAGWFIGR